MSTNVTFIYNPQRRFSSLRVLFDSKGSCLLVVRRVLLHPVLVLVGEEGLLLSAEVLVPAIGLARPDPLGHRPLGTSWRRSEKGGNGDSTNIKEYP